MKTPTIIAAIAVTVLVSGCGKKQSTAHVPGMRSQVDTSQVVAYGGVDTNNIPNLVMTVSEIWKGVGEASALGITNGTQFPFRWFTNSLASQPAGHFPDHAPDHAIVIIPHGGNPSTALRGGAIFYVSDGRILGMTIQEFKAKYGL